MKSLILTYSICIIIFSSCSLFDLSNDNGTAKEIIIKQPEFSISWDYTKIALTKQERASIYFTVYAKKHNGVSWTRLGTTDSAENSFSINTSILSPGRYSFAVTATIDEQESKMHTSEDDTADPMGGWYILWIPTE